ncbi:MAG: hypothetical protein IJH39_12805 [Clostridia bacterium]|nr:hypothetical protein [Clostridia bacterium]
MLGEKDLIFLGACILLNGESAKSGLHYVVDRDINSAIDISKSIFDNIFKDDSMVLE